MLPSPDASKSEWRAWARGVRAGLPDVSAPVTAHLRTLLLSLGARRVLAYRAMPGEPDVGALHGDFELFTPRARFRPAPHLTFHPWQTATEPSRFGALQPPADAPAAPLARMDVIVLPALAFDERGVRLGYGGGFYDRLLPAFPGVTVGVIPSALLLGALPAEEHDCPVHRLVTERGVLIPR
ncbi:5-formyltetrahydrofolate cyclo-ligase [Deinococcus taeanensis]|uniref:5-formyltetrahydrofolate cyclo-ligase n=1 Tax=Deinococcus taeanensis TaxID=2737050 RepID=UPI001CDCBCA1|nr:5-formyltetrahydrofolate cyclo-ligase [Deinococcus taeanensis]UBV41974.1 5-formyltetrahydrofolate cyclo-ligase [Deinococcus taeanensis]